MSQVNRLRKHAEKGLSKAQACDLEGCSHKTAADALKGTDLKWAESPTHWVRKGNTFPRAKSFHHPIQARLEQLRLKYPLDEVCRITGMNKGEQADAIWVGENIKGATYNWTLGQISRIAAAHGMTFAELIAEATNGN